MISLSEILHLRPTPTQWFETYIPRDKSVYALEALAGTGLVELEMDPRFASPVMVGEVREIIHHFDRLNMKYGENFPSGDDISFHLSDAPENVGHQAITTLRNHCAKITSLRRKEKHLKKEFNNLSLLLECLIGLECSFDIFERLSHESDFLYKGVFAHPASTPLNPDLNETIHIQIPGENHDFFIVAALLEKKQEIDSIFANSQRIDIPAWLTGDCHEKENQVQQHVEQLKKDISDTENTLLALRKEPQPAQAIANLEILRWFLEENAPELTRVQKLCHLTGWTTAEQADELQNALNKSHINATIRFTETPEGVKPPVMDYRSPWVSPFHIFVEMLGTPGRTEIDPSALLPIIVPLLFGFMFPDIGHGLILLLVGLLFRAYPRIRILVPCGLYSIAFGFLFGDFFGYHDVVHALLFNPMDDPIRILIMSMVFGFCLILLSIVFSGIEAYWQGKLRGWLILEATVLVFYASGLAGIFIPDAFIITPVALTLYLLGIVITSHDDYLSNIIDGIGRLFESIFELILNTFSFMRVGIFAIAHVGMSRAVNQLAADIENNYLHIFAFVVGHLVIIVVETMVVFIQTTRLVVFEFFIRFLRAEGRVFHPINPPTDRSRK